MCISSGKNLWRTMGNCPEEGLAVFHEVGMVGKNSVWLITIIYVDLY